MTPENEIIFGRRAVLEVLRAGRRTIHAVLIAEGAHGAIVTEAQTEARRRRLPIRLCPRALLDRLTHSGHHQGVALETSPYPYENPETMLRTAEEAGEPLFLLFLDHLHDPQNLGAILRSAEAVGVHGVILPEAHAAAVTPAAVRASSGAAEHLRVARVRAFAQHLREWKQRGLRLVGLESTPSLPLLTDLPLDGPIGLIIGNEGEGLTKAAARACDVRARLPMRGRIESLNASVSAGIALYEVRRQRDLRARARQEDVRKCP